MIRLMESAGRCVTFIPYLAMAPTTKAKSKAISASSFLELKAELAKKEEEISKLKAAGKSTTIAGGSNRPDKVSSLAPARPRPC